MNRTHEEDQLAFIVGHELAHSECQHSTRAVQIALAGRKLGGEVLGSGGEQVGEGLSVFSNRVLEATYDQDQEFEADRLGLCLAYLAGYDPRGGAGAMGTLASATPEASSAAPPTGSSRIAYDIISSHPPLSARSLYLKDLEGLIDAARARGLEPVVEAADAEELARALRTSARIVGINARDLRSFSVDADHAAELVNRIPPDRVAVFMSGVRSESDFARVAQTRADAVLIGEGLIRADQPGAQLAAWLRP